MTAIRRLALTILVIGTNLCSLTAEEESAGLLHAVGLNAESLRSYDVLIRVEVMKDIGPNDFERSVSFQRMRVDRDSERWLYLAHIDREVLVPGGELEKSFRMFGCAAKDGRYHTRDFPDRLVKNRNLLEALAHCATPDLRFIGISNFPRNYVQKGTLGSFEDWQESIRHAVNFEPIVTVNNVMRIRRFSTELGAVDNKYVNDCHLSPETLMPLRLESSRSRPASDGRVESERLWWETYEWESKNDVYVSTKIVGDQRSSALPMPYRKMSVTERREKKNEMEANGIKYIPYAVSTTVHFHWFSVNEPIDDSAFDLKALQDVTVFEGLVDPRISRAESLLGF